MALLVAGGFGIAGAGLVVATGYRKVKASFASKGVEHLLSEEERESLQAEHIAKIKECAGASGMKMGVRSSLHFLKVQPAAPPAIESILTMSRILQRSLGLSFLEPHTHCSLVTQPRILPCGGWAQTARKRRSTSSPWPRLVGRSS